MRFPICVSGSRFFDAFSLIKKGKLNQGRLYALNTSLKGFKT